MALYRYTAVDSSGRRESGTVEATNALAACQTLAARGLQIEEIGISMTPATQGTLPGSSGSSVQQPVASHPRTGGMLSTGEARELTTYVAELAGSQLPLAAGLRALAEEMPRSRTASSLLVLAQRLDRGMPLAEAIEGPDVGLPPYFRSLLNTASRAGDFSKMLHELLAHQRLTEELRGRLWQAIAYPVVLVSLMIAWCVFILMWLLPPMRKIWEDFDTRLPATTNLLIWLADHGPLLALIGLVIVVPLVLVARGARNSALLAQVMGRVPIVGPLWRNWSLSEFSNLLALLVERAMPLPEALELTATSVRHGHIAQGCREAARLVAGGKSLSAAIASLRAFPPSLVPLVEWGERTAALPRAMHDASEMFSTRAQLRDQFLAAVSAPVSFLLVAGVLMFVIVAMYSPLLELVSVLS